MGSACASSRPDILRRPSQDLFECIEQSRGRRLSEEDARYIFVQIVDIVDYLDGLGIIHRDIKDENLLIDQDRKVSSFLVHRSLTMADICIRSSLLTLAASSSKTEARLALSTMYFLARLHMLRLRFSRKNVIKRHLRRFGRRTH